MSEISLVHEHVAASSTERYAVLNCGQLVTLAGPARARRGVLEMRELSIVENGGMLIANGLIQYVGFHADIVRHVDRQTKVIDARGCVVTPGFVDAHTHIAFAGTRANEFEQRLAGSTYQEIAAAGGGILSTVRHTRQATEETLLATVQHYAEWFLRTGTTTLEAKSGYGLSLESELKILRVLCALQETLALRVVPTLLAAHAVPPEFRENRTAYIALVTNEILPQVVAQHLASYCDVFCDEYAFTLDESRRILTAAKQAGLGLRIHAEQFSADGAVSMAAQLGATTADHLECTDARGIAAMRVAGVQPVLLPASVFCLGRSRYPNARAMIDTGLATILATDFNPGSSPTTSMPFVMTLACQQMKMLPSEALVSTTINAAYGLNMGNKIGSLEAGKAADFLIHEFRDYRELAYFAAVPNLPQVFIAGKLRNTAPQTTPTKSIAR
ncbi:MAG TPA: imidazolonepropionase [Acidobacteriaceae bacterium]|jgi:imidazolonepropionase|nr:imidazolonepropionase [Acidobacteriaceae bacterium]